ncbi:MAG: glycoside hydrolase family 3 N-terminal domain-containing protein [Atopobiaceae bacterium]
MTQKHSFSSALKELGAVIRKAVGNARQHHAEARAHYKALSRPERRRYVRHAILRTVAVLLLVVVVAINIAAARFGESLDIVLSSDQVQVSQSDADARTAKGTQLAQQIQDEGTVLLKNDDSVLPLLSSDDRVNVFGWSSTQWIGGGSGSGGVSGKVTGFLDALTSYGISYNTELTNMYKDFKSERPYQSEGSLNKHDYEFCRLYEPDVYDQTYYTDQLLEDAKNYSDTAIVVLGRQAGESIDCPTRQYRVTDKSGKVKLDASRTYLDISPEEEDLLRYVGANYDKVVLVVNSTNTMNLGLLQTIPGIDAVVLAGTTGTSAASELPKVLWGEVDPSGRTTDTFAYNFKTAASYANSGAQGEGSYYNSFGVYPADGTLNSNVGVTEKYGSARFVDYKEGIYVGYRWYETADAEGYWNDVHNAYGDGYAGVVQYPFGYGLSYTTFKWQVVDRTPKAGSDFSRDTTFTYTVRVTNTGSVAGKDVVQLYYTAPYTKGGIEKSSTVLAAFAKTDLLQPGESQDVTLSFSADDMASYDCYDANGNGFAGYELEAGTYKVELKTDAHTLADCDHASTSYTLQNGILCENDQVTGAVVSNRFTGSSAEDGVSIDGSQTEGGITYLSRADFKGTFPTKSADRDMSQEVMDLNLYTASTGTALLDSTRTSASSELAVANAKTGEITSLGQELGLNYDDARWDSVLDNISQADMEKLVLHGYSSTSAIDSVGKPKTKDLDGSSQAASFHQMKYGVGYPNPTTLAQTWNTDLALQYGRQVGMECADLGIDGWYAPSANLHRSPMGGRNYEYYSEDPLISGLMASQTQLGSRQAGTYCYMKHMILNEQDSYRDSLYTWLTEQSLRELYLRPFKIAVEQGGATGIMSSYNRIGAVWAGGSSALLTSILRGEWGFEGAVITDYCDHQQYMNADQALLAGGDLYMDGVFRNGTFKGTADSITYRVALRRATKDVLYMWLNARATNLQYNASATQGAQSELVRPLKITGPSYVLIAMAVIDGLTALLLVIHFVRRYRKRHPKKPEPGDRDGDPNVNLDVSSREIHAG